MKIAEQIIDVEEIISKVLIKVFPNDPTWDIETYDEYCTIIEQTLLCLKQEDKEMKIRYYVSGLGYDYNDCVTDYERDFGDFDTYEEAYHAFVTLQCANNAMFFENVDSNIAYIKLQLEECKETEEEINCIDVRNEIDIERED